jgi:hypothetical protein
VRIIGNPTNFEGCCKNIAKSKRFVSSRISHAAADSAGIDALAARHYRVPAKSTTPPGPSAMRAGEAVDKVLDRFRNVLGIDIAADLDFGVDIF